jgi:uncharacterized protein
MRWQGRRGSGNIEDRRRMGPVGIAGGGVVGLIVIVLFLCLGGDPRALMEMQQNAPPGAGGPVDPAQDEAAQFVSVVVGDTEEVWHDLFREAGKTYREPTLVMFTHQTQSACGYGSSATGPFYCPPDEKVYIDLSFFDDMARRLNAPGDAAQAYVIAHEVGHHVQNLLGVSDRVHAARERVSEDEYNELSVRLELQADYLAGVWAHHANRKWKVLEEGDVEEVLNAASAIGDDRLQMQQQGYVVPESFTHGTAEQRARWFVRGLKSGRMSEGDTFNIPYSQL